MTLPVFHSEQLSVEVLKPLGPSTCEENQQNEISPYEMKYRGTKNWRDQYST